MPSSPRPTPPKQRAKKQITAMRNRGTVTRLASQHQKVRKSKGG